MRNLLTDHIRRLPADLRTILLPFVYGLFGGLAAFAFQKGVSIIFSMFWEMPSQQMQRAAFAFFSLATILVVSIIAGLILTFVSRDGETGAGKIDGSPSLQHLIVSSSVTPRAAPDNRLVTKHNVRQLQQGRQSG